MGKITEQNVWNEEIYSLELEDPVVGGAPEFIGNVPVVGFANAATQQLANRTLYLKFETDEVRQIAEDAMDAVMLNGDIYPDEATGRAAVADGEYFRVIGTGDVALYIYRRVSATVSTLVASYPSLTAIKNIAFVQGTRDGITSVEPTQFLNFVKDVTIQGIERGKIFKIEYFQNRNAGFEPVVDSFIFSTFENKQFEGRIQLNNRQEAIVELDRSLNKQVVQLNISGYIITLLLNPSALPPVGTALFANQTSTPGYSWYVGETAYIYKDDPSYELSPFFDFYDVQDLLTVDLNNVPIKGDIAGRENVTYSPFFNFYDTQSLVTVDNNNISLEPSIEGMDIVSYSPFFSFSDTTSYEEFDTNGISLTPISDTPPTPPSMFGKSGKIFVDFKSSTKELSICWQHNKTLMFKTIWKPNGYNSVFNFYQHLYAPVGDPDTATWTLHQSSTTDYIPPITHYATSGTTSTNVSTTGGNHPGANGELTGWLTQCDFYLDNHWLLTENYKGYHDSVLVRWVNLLCAGNTVTQQRITTRQDFVAVFTARNVEVLSKVTALEPIEIIREGGTQMVFSGWEDGGYHFYQGVQQRPVKYLQRSGSLMAATRSANVISGTATPENTINIFRLGVQVGTGTVLSTGAYSITLSVNMFDGDVMVVNEMNGATQVATVTVEYIISSGTKAEAPNVWANVVKNNTLGYFAAWLDRSFGVKTDWIKDDNPINTRNLSKCYNFSVKWDRVGGNTDPYRQMATGDTYSWRGGYSYSPVDIVEGLSSAFTFEQNGKLRLAVANSSESLSGVVKLPEEYLSADFETIGPIDGIGTELEFPTYSATFYKESN